MAGPRFIERRRAGEIRLADACCRAGKSDRPFPEEHAEWAVAIVRRGTFVYRSSDGPKTTLTKDWILASKPGRAFECSHEHDGGDDCTVLNVPAAIVHEAARTFSKRAPSLGVVSAPIAGVAARFERASRAASRGDSLEMDVLAMDIVRGVVGEGARGAEIRAENERMRACAEWLEARSEEDWSLDALASEVDVSPFHFARMFRATIGVSPHRYLVGARLRRAARLLLDTDTPITSVAYDVGFGDLSNFIRTFRREIGSSPRAFRGKAMSGS